MERVSAADASFLYLENEVVHLHVSGFLLLDPSTAEKPITYRLLRAHVNSRLDVLPMLRQRLVEVPYAIDHPEWADDPDFDLDTHFRRHRLPRPGTHEQLAEYLGLFASVPLDRSRPLWDFVVVEGLADGHVAVATKMHHCLVDGISGVEILAHLLDLSPRQKVRRRRDAWAPPALPERSDVAAGALWHRLATPMRPVRAAASTAASMVQAVETLADRWLRGARAIAHPINAPRTRLNGSITPNRTVAFATVPLGDLKEVRRSFGTTVNDVVLAMCTTGLRRYLAEHDTLPDRALVCSVPVSVHGENGHHRSTNQVSNMFVHLPVHLDDPVEQLRTIREGTKGAKEVQAAVGANMIGDVVELLPPNLFAWFARQYSRVGLADRMAPVHNLIVSNVPGAPVPLYFAGAEVVGIFPFGPLMEGTGLNITVLSGNDRLHIGVIACPELVPHLDELLDGILDGLTTLSRLAGELDADAQTL